MISNYQFKIYKIKRIIFEPNLYTSFEKQNFKL